MMVKSAHSAQVHPTKQQPNQLTMQPTDLPCKWINDFHSLSWHIKKAAMPLKGFVVWLLSGTSSKFWQIESGWVGPDRPQHAKIRHSQPIQPFLVSCQLFAPNGGGDVPILWLFFWLKLPPCILVAAQCMSANGSLFASYNLLDFCSGFHIFLSFDSWWQFCDIWFDRLLLHVKALHSEFWPRHRTFMFSFSVELRDVPLY